MNVSCKVHLQWGAFDKHAAHRAILRQAWVRKHIQYALACAGDITVRIVGEAEGRALNLQFRGKDYATNVLTFDYAQSPVVVADVVLCAPVIAREATAQHKALADHYAHLLIHATLHAQGYEHEGSAREALKMEATEILLLASLGYENPY